jgi:hypothetical protein
MSLTDLAKFLPSGGGACIVMLAALVGLGQAPAVAQTTASPAAGVQVSCAGQGPDGWSFATEALDGRFLHVIWTGSVGQTRVAMLTFGGENAEGFPVYFGTLRDTIPLSLVDMSAGAPGIGTDVIVHSEDWGWFTGTCRFLGGAEDLGVMSTDAIRRNLVGTRDTSATNWLRRNGFTLVRLVTQSAEGKTERWQQDPAYQIDVIYSGTIVSEVVAAAG